VAIKNSELRYSKIPKNKIQRQEAEKTIAKWRLQSDDTTKWWATKEHFSEIKE